MNCKHRWIESPWAKKIMARRVNADREYFYHCTRCSEARFTTLLKKENPALWAGSKEGELMNKTTGAVG